jgi:hypothetical protein
MWYTYLKRADRCPHCLKTMQTSDLFTPCSVGDLRLPPKFQAVIHCLYVDTKAGQPTRGWFYLPAGLVLSWACEVDHAVEVELWSCGPLSLTREATQDEIDAYWESDWA